MDNDLKKIILHADTETYARFKVISLDWDVSPYTELEIYNVIGFILYKVDYLEIYKTNGVLHIIPQNRDDTEFIQNELYKQFGYGEEEFKRIN